VLTDSLLVLAIKLFQQFVCILPENGQQGIGVFFGRIAFYILKRRRSVALTNIKRVFSNSDVSWQKRIAKKCFENMGTNFIELLLVPYLSRAEYNLRFSIEDRRFADEALKMHRGLIALVFHYANWEIMGITSRFFENDVIALARPLKKHVKLNNFLNSLRISTGLKILPNINTSRDIMRCLKEDNIIAILADQREKRSRGVFVELFGEKAPTSRGIAMIGMKTGAPVIPFYLVRKGFLRYTLVCGKPIDMERKGNIEELIHKNTRKINAFLETIILKHPEEWFWVHRRWGRDASTRRGSRGANL
jgi:KDO2-lipid IV(A) lauroyltransferase